MIIINGFCQSIVSGLTGALPNVNFVYAYEPNIKEVPTKKVTCAVSVKSCDIGKITPVQDTETGIIFNNRDIKTVIAVNIYTPHAMGTAGGIDVFERIINQLSILDLGEITTISLTGTKYSRETQSLITHVELSFESTFSESILSAPVTPV